MEGGRSLAAASWAEQQAMQAVACEQLTEKEGLTAANQAAWAALHAVMHLVPQYADAEGIYVGLD